LDLFSLKGKNAVILGGAGVLGGALSEGLAAAGANVLIADMAEEMAAKLAAKVAAEADVRAAGCFVNAMQADSLTEVCSRAKEQLGTIDILVNAVGGNRKGATVSDDMDFFSINPEELRKVVDLNLFGGAILPSQIFGKAMAGQESGGSIINISSMNAFRPLTRIAGYSAAKAAVSNFTQWLAVYLAQAGCTSLRVNAIAPGFFLTAQNRFLLTDEKTGALTARGQKILDHTPMARFGDPADLVGTLIWLASDAARFVTGIVVPIDGGFSAYSGV